MSSAVYTLAASGSIGGGIARLLQPQADYFSTLNLPGWLIHWGHPGDNPLLQNSSQLSPYFSSSHAMKRDSDAIEPDAIDISGDPHNIHLIKA